ncbi:hypothetical protein [Haladaptatus sp. DJG-WS-42]|uniref:hypothetical protein n=1 Tax=Haladaptatus sp. DJG-WS-42 TaxID=3120516 RepID=UPI0030D23C70
MSVPASALSGAALAFAACVVFWALCLRGYAWWVLRRSAKPTARLRRGILIGLAFAAATTFATVRVAGLDEIAFALVGETPTADLLGWVVGGLCGVVAVLTAYRGMFPYLLRARDLDMSATTALLRLARYVGGIYLLLVVSLVPVIYLSGVAIPLVTVAFIGAIYAVSPRLSLLISETRDLTPAKRDRLDRLCEDVSLDVTDVHVLPGEENKWAGATVSGPPGRRQLFVTDYLLDTYDDDGARALLAAAAGQTAVWYREYRIATVLLFAGWVWTVVFAPIPATGRQVLAGLVVVCLLLWLGARLVYRADRVAGERTDPGLVAETYERVGNEQEVDFSQGFVTSLVRMKPSLNKRINRLYNQV